MKVRVLGALASAILATTAISAQAADNYPSKPVVLIVSYPAGGSVDLTARLIQEPLAKLLGQPVIVDNRGGAGGTIATALVSKAAPDGHSVLFTLSSHTINPAIYSKLAFDTEADFAPVTQVVSSPQILVAHPSFPAKSLAEMNEYIRKRGVEVPYGSAGSGSPGHLAGELYRLKTNLPMVHVGYRGGGPAVLDVLGGQIPLLWVSLPAIAQYIKQGKVVPLAVSTAKRFPAFPDVPSVSESVADFNVDSWNAMFVPAKTPQPVIDKLQKAVQQVTSQPEIQKALLDQGATAVGSSSKELGAIVTREIKEWRSLTEAAGIKLQ